MSVPREIKLVNGKITAYPVEEVRHLIKDTDPSVVLTDKGFVIHRRGMESVVHDGDISDIKILRDNYILEVFVNGGETVYSVFFV